MRQATARQIRTWGGGITMPYVASILLLAGAYVAAAEIGFSFAQETKQITAVWIPTGIAVAVLVLRGYKMWPGILIGALVANAFASEPFAAAAGIALGNTAAPLFAALLLQTAGFKPSLQRARDVVALVVLGSALPMAVSASNGVFDLSLAGLVSWNNFWPACVVWWVGDAMGVLVIAPLILTWASDRGSIQRGARGAVEYVVLVFSFAATAAMVFDERIPLEFFVYPFAIWSAMRFRQRETALVLTVICGIAVWGTAHGHGPFVGDTLDRRLLMLDLYLAVLVLTALILGAVMAERRLAAAELKAAERRFQVLAQTVPQMVWTADASGWIDWHNERWHEYTGQTAADASGWGWQRAHHIDDVARMMEQWPRSIATGEPFEIESRIRRRDGAFRWFLTRAEPLRDQIGNILRWYGTHTDIDDQKRALQQTARVAETLQKAFLPRALPARRDVTFDAHYLTAGSDALIGGDWYDALELPDGQLVISIGDVIGHGLGAAVTAGRIRQGIISAAFDNLDPAAILRKVNRLLQLQEDTVATALVAIIDADLKTLHYASAGHPPPILAGPNIPVHSLPYGSAPLGVDQTSEPVVHTAQLERQAILVFYTDGVTEFNRDIESNERTLRQATEKLVGDNSTAHPAASLQRAVMGTTKPVDDAVVITLSLCEPVGHALIEEYDLRKSWSFHSSDAYSAHASRGEVMAFLRRFVASEEELFRAELVIGELLANTVEHAPGLVNVTIDWTAAEPTITIIDNGPGLAPREHRLPDDTMMEDGRGLFLVETLASNVLIESAPGFGTKLSVVLPVQRAHNVHVHAEDPIPAATE